MPLLVLNSLVDGSITLFPTVKKEGHAAVLQNLLYNFRFTPDSDQESYDRARFKNLQVPSPTGTISTKP